MADAYGMMILNPSKDLDCDFDGLIESLNRYEWNSSGNKWVKKISDGEISVEMDCFGLDQVQYPTVYPNEFKGVVIKTSDGKEQFINNPTDEEFDYAFRYIYTQTTLKQLAQDISQKITNGNIEISSVCNEKKRYIRTDDLIICSDGTATRTSKTIGDGYDEEFSEQFDGKE